MIEKIISEAIGCDQGMVQDHSKFVDDLGADSLNIVEIVMAIEEEFDVSIPDEDAESITTVSSAIKYIDEHK